MKLYYSQNSPFSRIARITVRELGMQAQVSEIPSANRQPDNPVLDHSPVGRVPTLVDGDTVITETRDVCAYLFAKSGATSAKPVTPVNWGAVSQEGLILGFVDGIATWVRENRREAAQQSEFLIGVEQDRSARCLVRLEQDAASGKLGDFAEFRFMALAAGLDLMRFHEFHPTWDSDYPALSVWFAKHRERESMLATAHE